MKPETLNTYKLRLLDKPDEIPYGLLLLADESREAIDQYIHKSEIYTLQSKEEAIAVYVLLRIDKATIEIKNIAVQEN